MAKVYMIRHQVAGILTSHVFTKKPTEEQVAAVKDECEQLHGTEFKGKAPWVAIHEAELMGDEVPAFPKREPGKPAMKPFGISGTGTVTNPVK